MKRKLFIVLALLGVAFTSLAQVDWTCSFVKTGDATGEAVFKAVMSPGWHLYASDAEGVPAPLKISFENGAFESDGRLEADKGVTVAVDELTGCRQTWWADSVTIVKKFRNLRNVEVIKGSIRYSACDNNSCMPPKRLDFILKVPSHDTRQARALRPE